MIRKFRVYDFILIIPIGTTLVSNDVHFGSQVHHEIFRSPKFEFVQRDEVFLLQFRRHSSPTQALEEDEHQCYSFVFLSIHTFQ